jgi:hypothetical protein
MQESPADGMSCESKNGEMQAGRIATLGMLRKAQT